MVKSSTRILWNSIGRIYSSILGHPFVRGLTDGSLEERKFRFYVVQDALYLSEYARALSLAGVRSPNDQWLMMFNEHSRTAILVERSLHQGFFKNWGLREEDVYGTPMAPANLAYTSYLIATAYSKPFHELLGALLPCYWIYWEVGKELEKRGSRKKLYQRWIDTYASKEYGEVCDAVLNVAESVAGDLSPGEFERMKDHFVTTSRYEYMFWDMADKLESWPV